MQTGTGLLGGAPQPAFMAGRYEGEALAALPPVLPLQIQANGRVFGADGAQVKSYHQELRLREGVLVTRATWESGVGSVELEIHSALLRQAPGMALVQVAVENRSRVPVSVGVPDKAIPPSGAVTGKFLPGSFYYETAGTDCRLFFGSVDHRDLAPSDPFRSPAEGFRTRCSLPAGQSARFVVTSLCAGGTGGTLPMNPDGTPDVETGLREHREEWERLWASDIEIEGDPEAQQVVRACLFYLLCSIREGSAAGVPPMGLGANAFNGHVFWDMDSWMLPALLPQHPELARAMLEYRFRTLEGARANARAEGLPGASYAWESASTGRETLGKEAVFRQGRHVTGDVALALKQYYAATGDQEWLRRRAWPILKETADNWAARAQPDGGGAFVVKGVTTPDENAGKVSHSAWTHHVARVNLQFAGEAAQTLGLPPNPRWQQVAKGLTVLRSPDGVILAYEGFTERAKAKQADALLLEFPGGMELSPGELGRMYDFYAPRVIRNGPAMTDAIHALVAARLGRDEEALARFHESYRPFVRPPFHLFSEKRTRDNLPFLTGAAGVVEAVLYGFAGLRLEPSKKAPDRPRLEPHLPHAWTALRLRNLQWRGKAWDVEMKPGAAPRWTARAAKGSR
jgi:trehalose/maltose hydrolase-like predicted phosphorylase